MITKMKNFWNSLDEMTAVSKRELFLGVVSAALLGAVLGMILTPKKTVTIGSNNSGNGCNCGNGYCDCDEEEEEA
ncbi:MAG: hypothetical protein SO019_10390 [Lachnospiraceae bacterium]|mgnify:CR=1 FL=1|nr:hypothetical protein [Lachnospiraceae bacterium]MDY3819451.1 hypothetical protein [Lachnospiraceae bacterium]